MLEITADDFGANAGLDAGIFLAAGAGAIQRISAFAARVRPEHQLPDVPIGVHLDLCDGPFLTQYRPDRGRLGDKRDVWLAAARGQCDPTAIHAEADSQIVALSDRLGHPPAHLDVHNHLHLAHPDMLAAVSAAANRHGIRRVRWPVEHIDHDSARWLARLDRMRGIRPTAIDSRTCGFDLDVLEELVRQMRHSALADALVYQTAAARLSVPAGSLEFCGTVFGHRPSLAILRAHARRAEQSQASLELMTHPGVIVRGRGFAGPGRTRELLVLLAHRASRSGRRSG